jgi:hypothetical protein
MVYRAVGVVHLDRTRFGSCTMTHYIYLFGSPATIFFEILILIVV